MKVNVLASGVIAATKARHLAEGGRSVPGRPAEVIRTASQ